MKQHQNEEENEKAAEVITQTRSERNNRMPSYTKYYIAMTITKAESGFHAEIRAIVMQDFSNKYSNGINYKVTAVSAGIGGEFENTHKLKVMKYEEAMQSDKVEWSKAVSEEYEKMKYHKVWRPVKLENVPIEAKILTLTWAMQKKSNGTYRARLNARGYERINEHHDDESAIHVLSTNAFSVRIVMILALMTGWIG